MRTAIFLMLFGCVHTPPTPPEGETCESACERAAQLDCAWGRPTTEGLSCVDVCEDVGEFFALGLACMTKAPTCAEMDRCGR